MTPSQRRELEKLQTKLNKLKREEKRIIKLIIKLIDAINQERAK